MAQGFDIHNVPTGRKTEKPSVVKFAVLCFQGQEVAMGNKIKVIVLNGKDNVGTALEPLATGTTVSIEVQCRVEKIRLISHIPMGHKFALWDIEKGAAVIKYGEPIGRSAAKICRGEHVHVHNVVNQPVGGER